MKPGDQLRFRGPGGAPFLVTVGVAFSPEYVATQVSEGVWVPIEDQAPTEKPAPKRRPARSTTKPTQ